LNERIAGKRITPIHEVSNVNFPSFKLFEEEIPNNQKDCNSMVSTFLLDNL
jgi:hypothetical protein